MTTVKRSLWKCGMAQWWILSVHTESKLRIPKTGKKYRAPFVLVKSDFTPLISDKTAEDMGTITIDYEVFKLVHIVQENSCVDIRPEFPKPFENGVGQFRDDLKTVKQHADDGVPAKVVPAKRVAIALKPKAKAALDDLERKNIIIKQDSPTDWVSQMAVSVKRSEELRICIDPQALNQALKHKHYQLPVIEDILPDLNKVQIFSKLDLRYGFWHCELDEESSLLTTFSTPFGRYRWKKLPFWLSVSSEIFQKRLNMAIEGLNGVKVSQMTYWSSVKVTLKLRLWVTTTTICVLCYPEPLNMEWNSNGKNVNFEKLNWVSWVLLSPVVGSMLIPSRLKMFLHWKSQILSMKFTNLVVLWTIWPNFCQIYLKLWSPYEDSPETMSPGYGLQNRTTPLTQSSNWQLNHQFLRTMTLKLS